MLRRIVAPAAEACARNGLGRLGRLRSQSSPVPWAPMSLDVAAALGAIVKAYDVRGTYPDQINADLARRIGTGFARFVAQTEPDTTVVVVGHDMRPSGPELVDAFCEGVCGEGLDVVEIGLASTDMLYFASGKLNAPGAMFTASHYPAQYIGFKLCLSSAKPIGSDTGLATIRDTAAEADTVGDGDGSRSSQEMLAAFADHVRSFVDTSTLKPLKVVADTANGMGGLVVPAVFESLPFDLEIMYPELDGTFPNHPADPIQPENQAALRARVLEVGADIGLAFDGDADRVFLVDEKAQGVSGSTTTALVASGILDKKPGATIIHNLICSKRVPEIVAEKGGRAVRTRVGHSYIKAVMADEDGTFGGEHSGHYYFKDNWRADSGLIAALVVLEQLCAADAPLSELRKPIETKAISGEIYTEVSDQQAVLDKVASHYEGEGATIDRLDGLTVDLGEWWFNLRPSNTEPLLRLNLEAPDRESCDQHTEAVLALVREPVAARAPVPDPRPTPPPAIDKE
jgi:phosphomannomutase